MTDHLHSSQRSPHRMLLGDLPLFLRHHSENFDHHIIVRLMGRVTEISQYPRHSDRELRQTLIERPQQSKLDERVRIFVIDDGTGILDVVDARFDDELIDAPRESLGISTASRIDAHLFCPVIIPGVLVDCIGRIHFDRERRSDGVYLLEATCVSVVGNQQEETLRQLELCSRESISHFHADRNHCSYSLPSYRATKITTNRVLVAGDLSRSLNSFHHTTHPFPSITFKTDDALRYINYSEKYGGISGKELESLVGAGAIVEKTAVRTAVEGLQKRGMVCMKDGRYYPL